MSTKQPQRSKLQVTSAGHLHYIQVPAAEAAALQGYLRQHGVWAGQPEPCYSNVDTIELARGANAAAIQELLNRWV
jgi:hypothetical protein